MPFEDSPSLQINSPFEAGASPVGRRKSSVITRPGLPTIASTEKIREGARGRAGPSPDKEIASDSAPSPKASPKKRQSSEGKSGRGSTEYKDSENANAAEALDDTYGGDDYGDNGAAYIDQGEDLSSSASKGRRVSFGENADQDNEQVERAPAGKRGRGRPSSKAKISYKDDIEEAEFGVEKSARAIATPESARSARTDHSTSTPGSDEFPRGRKIADETFDASEEEEDAVDRTDVQGTDSEDDGYAHDSFVSMRKRKHGLNDIEADEEEEEDEAYEGVRRSRRVTKGKKLAWWKGERPVYDGGRMIGLLTANPTPAKKQKGKTANGGSSFDNQGVRRRLTADDNFRLIKAETPVVLPDGVSYLSRNRGSELQVWDYKSDASKNVKVVCYAESLQPPSALPITAPRPPGKDEVCYAAQSFSVPEISGSMSGWISGYIELPAGAIKDAEGVGECAQVFFISECQEGALELGVSDPAVAEWREGTAQRQLLSKGDSFYVPPGNIYRLENHSANQPCFIFWTIVKPLSVVASVAAKSSGVQ